MRAAARILSCTIAVSGIAASAQAEAISVYGWATTEVNSQNAVSTTLLNGDCHFVYASAIPVRPCTHANADVSFTTSGINFTGAVGDIGPINSMGNWLDSSAFPLNDVSFQYFGNVNAVTRNTYLDPSIWEFTGTAAFFTGQTFTIPHGDGVTFTVNGQTVVSSPGSGLRTATGTYTGPSGNLQFQIIYGDSWEPGPTAARLQVDLLPPGGSLGVSADPVPEPASLVLLGTGLAVAWRSLKKKANDRGSRHNVVNAAADGSHARIQ